MERLVWPIHGIGDDFGLFIWQNRYLVPTMFDGSARKKSFWGSVIRPSIEGNRPEATAVRSAVPDKVGVEKSFGEATPF
ncbi:unnamed protein product [Alternaria alternata]